MTNEVIKARVAALVGDLHRGRKKKWTEEEITRLLDFLEAQGARDSQKNFNIALPEAAKKFNCTVGALRAVIYSTRKTGEVY